MLIELKRKTSDVFCIKMNPVYKYANSPKISVVTIYERPGCLCIRMKKYGYKFYYIFLDLPCIDK